MELRILHSRQNFPYVFEKTIIFKNLLKDALYKKKIY